MKNIRTVALNIVFALAMGALTVGAGPANSNKVRYKVNEALVSSGIDADASGQVQALLKQQGNSAHQRLRVTVKNLDANASYTLLALVGTNESYITVTNFTTSGLGKSKIAYAQNRALTDDGHVGTGSGVNKRALPAVIDPLTDVRALAIANAGAEVVLSLNLHESLGMEFELTSVFTSTETDPYAIGCVAVACQNGSTQFRLFAAGDSSQYTFCVNEAPVASYSADYTGRISVGTYPEGAPSPLFFKTLDLRNAGDAVILKSVVQ